MPSSFEAAASSRLNSRAAALISQKGGTPKDVDFTGRWNCYYDLDDFWIIDGVPQRVIKTAVIDRLESGGVIRRLLRALRHAWAFRRATGTSFSTMSIAASSAASMVMDGFTRPDRLIFQPSSGRGFSVAEPGSA